MKLIESVYVPGVTNFVVHVDGKEKSDDTYERLVEYAREINGSGKEDVEYIRIVGVGSAWSTRR